MTFVRSTSLLALLSAALAGLCWLPTGLAPLLPLAFLGMMLALGRARSGKEAARLGLILGAARYAVAAHFLLALLYYSPLAFVFYILAILFILPMAVLETWGAWFLERRLSLPRPVGFALIWTLMEKLRTVGDLSFPADLAAHCFGSAPAFLAWADFIGPFGVTLALLAVAVLLERAWATWPSRRPAAAWGAAALVLWTAPPLSASLEGGPHSSAAQPALAIGIVQPSFSQEDQRRRDRWPLVWERLRRLTLEAAPQSDLILWPESARPGFVAFTPGQPVEDPEVGAIAKAAGTPILYGTVLAETDGRDVVSLYNAAVLVDSQGKVAGWYGKQQLLPFVEGLPFARRFGWTPRERAKQGPRRGYLGMLGNFTPGPTPTLFEVQGAKIGVLICYEGMYPGLVRSYSRSGANALAVLTNDIWWGKSAFAPWHARMVAARTRESRLPCVRAANSGICSLTDAAGTLLARTRFDEVRTLQVSLATGRRTPTFYALYGDWILFLIPLAPLLSWGLRAVRGRRPGSTPIRRQAPESSGAN